MTALALLYALTEFQKLNDRSASQAWHDCARASAMLSFTTCDELSSRGAELLARIPAEVKTPHMSKYEEFLRGKHRPLEVRNVMSRAELELDAQISSLWHAEEALRLKRSFQRGTIPDNVRRAPASQIKAR